MRPTASKAEVEFANCVAIYFDQGAARPTHPYQHNTISTSYPLQAMNNVRGGRNRAKPMSALDSEGEGITVGIPPIASHTPRFYSRCGPSHLFRSCCPCGSCRHQTLEEADRLNAQPYITTCSESAKLLRASSPHVWFGLCFSRYKVSISCYRNRSPNKVRILPVCTIHGFPSIGGTRFVASDSVVTTVKAKAARKKSSIFSQ
jgi:hypothetical protein